MFPSLIQKHCRLPLIIERVTPCNTINGTAAFRQHEGETSYKDTDILKAGNSSFSINLELHLSGTEFSVSSH